MEVNFDFIYIMDANDNVVETLTGSFNGHTTANIPTSVGKVRLVTDQFVTAQGFTVDQVVTTADRRFPTPPVL